MEQKLRQLKYWLETNGFPNLEISLVPTEHGTATPSSFHQRGQYLIRVDWPAEPTAAQIGQVQTLIMSFVPKELKPDILTNNTLRNLILNRMIREWAKRNYDELLDIPELWQ